MLDNLSKKLTKIIKTISGNSRLTESNIEEILREIRIALLEADVAISVSKTFIESIKKEAIGKNVLESLTPSQMLISIVHDKLVELLGTENHALNLSCVPPAIILLAGLQGSGKTTTASKLAKFLQDKEKKKVLVTSCDVYRPAAISQLEILCKNLNTPFFKLENSNIVLDIASEALKYAKNNHFDVLIVDTAGRLSIDEKLMQEIKELKNFLNPIETLFIADSMLGQDVVNTAKAFNDLIDITGIILTKMDGDARGGAALSIREVTHKSIKFIGVSEKATGLEPFYPKRLASRILGMGDVLSLIDEAKSNFDEDKAKELLVRVQKGKKFNLEDFKEQFLSISKMGGTASIMDKLPTQFQGNLPISLGDNMIKKYVAIINSMTFLERKNPEILKASRKRRIASGSGTKVQDVNQLLNQYEQMQNIMKKFSGANMFKMMKQFKHFIPKF